MLMYRNVDFTGPNLGQRVVYQKNITIGTKNYCRYCVGLTVSETDYDVASRYTTQLDENGELIPASGKMVSVSFIGGVFRSGYYIGGGQNLSDVRAGSFRNLDVKYKDLVLILRCWKNWHLNDMVPGTDEQMKFVHLLPPETSRDYDSLCLALKDAGLYYNGAIDGRPYKYGSQWLHKPMPDPNVNDICAIFEKYPSYPSR